jgi:OmpA-OmpF porin, OOP family
MRVSLGLSTLVASALLATATPRVARAQEAPAPEPGSIALNQFDPAPIGDAFFGVPSPYAHGKTFEPRFGLVFDGSEKPLNLRDDVNSGSVVGRQVFMNVGASAAIMDRALFDIMFPVALVQRGESPVIQGTAVASPEVTQAGDLRIGLRIRLFGDVESPFQIGAGGYVFAPTGATDLEDGTAASYTGEGSVRVQPYASFGGRFNALIPWRWTVMGGALLRGSDNPSTIRYGAGIAALINDGVMQLGPEFYASTPLQSSLDFKATGNDTLALESGTNAELLMGLKVRIWRFVTGAAAGPGFTKAIGTPRYRVAFSVAYDPEAELADGMRPTSDTDEDGIDDDDDVCPWSFGPHSELRNGCPVLDDDEDGVPNERDACPNEYGTPSDNPDNTGCAPRVE